ncbi:DUF4382 domain-containing protein [Vibrio sp. 10N.261.55.A7]|uniref:DUF4382 domain-containing protein n=1 Tax=Vibrio sp. 10N.261.55.A7 TaxID=1880851 RepID=UPI000C81CB50|nr:DUF4382 domain-containing protein [Vibrio sp. 10N.261.55.A7]PMJ89850.1 hypothetical protein BCU12_01345 [Vibrio sp. 10N.261.55.A7]
MNTFYQSATAVGALLMLFGCIGEEPINLNTANFSLTVSDAAMDGVDSMVVVYSNATLIPLDGSKPIIIDIQSRHAEKGRVDLLDYQESNKANLISNQAIPPGDYQLCLTVLNGESQNEALSHVVESNTYVLTPLTILSTGVCPKDSEVDGTSTLYFNSTLLLESGDNHFIVEFDLRGGLKAPTDASDPYTIESDSFTLIDERDAGLLSGTISHSIVEQCRIDNRVAFTVDAVYLYPSRVARSNMGGFSNEGLYAVAPVAAANVTTYDGIHYEFDIGYVEEGTYSLGYTCVADKDQADTDRAGQSELVSPAFNIYQAEQPVRVYPQHVSEVDFSFVI